ncbi:glycerophosphocholine phosphodiesterase [Martiniozyma asiatica (nom. inval.)]|nr:glycerophosphocholine phosphodiesterase [Martiniozyma asiatica]
MKFGHTFLSHQVPEWQSHYMDYKVLKKVIKAISIREKEIIEFDKDANFLNDSIVKTKLAEFFFTLDENIIRVDDFYTKKFTDYEKRLKKITSAVPADLSVINDIEELDELISISLELRNCLRNLKWFAELNKRGFIKILKKLDKKAGTLQQATYLNAKIFPMSFSNEINIVNCLRNVNSLLNKLSNTTDENEGGSIRSKSETFSSSVENFDLNLPPPTSVFASQSSKKTKKISAVDLYMPAIKADDSEELDGLLIKEFMSPVLAPLKLLISLLNKSTLELSYKCIDKLLTIIPVLGDTSDVSGKNFIHQHVIILGKQFAQKNESFTIGKMSKSEYNDSLLNTSGSDGANSNDSFQGLLYIFENLPTHLKFAILQKDNYKRTALHYSAQYGMKDVTSIIVKYMIQWGLLNENISIDNVEHWGDSEGLTPLHLSVLGKHPKTTQILLDTLNDKIQLSCPYLLHVATRLNCPEILKALLKCNGIDINSYERDQTKETALYIAAKMNLKESVEFLLDNGADTEIGEASFGWTPIFVAAADGNKDIIEILITKGAEFFGVDESGWTPREHAALRGHIHIVPLLTPPDYNPYDMLDSLASPRLSPSMSPPLAAVNSIHKISDKKGKAEENRIELNHIKEVRKNRYNSNPVTKVGNKYLKNNDSYIVITLGTTDKRDTSVALDLKKVPLSKIHSTELDSALSIVISAKNLPGEPEVAMSLPLDDNHGSTTEPITFHVSDQDPFDTTIYFDIVPTFDITLERKNNSSRKILGRGVAVLRDVYTPVGPNKRSLYNAIRVPIMETNTMEILGTVKFEFLCVTSFEKNGVIPNDAKYWKAMSAPRLIGHRGNGMNQRSKKSLQLGENTIESFIAAASLGAQYVEFDVQLTKDDVPVIYHDFIVAESGLDIPMHSLTLEQFMHINAISGGGNIDKKQMVVKDDTYIPSSKSKYISGNSFNDDHSKSRIGEINPNHERMKLTKTWKLNEFKANSRGTTIASSFTTLEELFKKVPKSAGFNIELKYPMLDESEADDIGQIAPDMNHFCDTILKLIYEKYEGRDIIFSSFHPDICMMMTMKQPTFPVLLLTESGVNFTADVRASSLQNAIRFAKNWNLFGIVSDATPIIHCPRLVTVVKATGLAFFTYGSANNDPENAKLEIAAGVDAVIVDSVLAVRKGLTKYDEDSAKMKATLI